MHIHRRRAGLPEHCRRALEVVEKGPRIVGRMRERGEQQTECGRHADGGRAAHLHGADGVRDLLGRAAADELRVVRQARLVDQHQGTLVFVEFQGAHCQQVV